MKLILTEGGESAAAERLPVADSQPLTDIALHDVLSKLSDDLETASEQPFRLRKGPQPPPLTGDDLRDTFPASAELAAPAPDVPTKLEVLHVLPAGEVPVAPNVSVTFNQPVVPLGYTGPAPIQLFQNGKPVAPEVGVWRARGTSAFVFEPRDRMPGSSTYRIVVPAGLQAPSGATLDEAVEAEFSTRPLELLRAYPESQVGPGSRPVVVLVFDQVIHRHAVAERLQIWGTDGGLELVDVATSEALAEEDEEAAEWLGTVRPNTWIAVRPRAPLGGSSTVLVPAGMSSAEGPRPTPEQQSHFLNVAEVFHVQGPPTSYGYGRHASWWIPLSNDVDPGSLSKDAVTLEPSVDDVRIWASKNHLAVSGRFRGSSRYTLQLSDAVRDRWGQRLSGDPTVTFQTPPSEPALEVPGGRVITFGADAPRKLTVGAINVTDVEIRAYRVRSTDFQTFQQTMWLPVDQSPSYGTFIESRTVTLAGAPEEYAEHELDLSWVLPVGGTDQVVLRLVPRPQSRQTFATPVWVQSTRIGARATWDQKGKLLVWATTLAEGRPMAGCEARIPHSSRLGLGTTVQRTDPSGVAELQVPENYDGQWVEVANGDDHCLVQAYLRHYPQSTPFAWHVFNDRGMYRPGETVRIRGWMRKRAGRTGADLEIARHAAGPDDGLFDRVRGWVRQLGGKQALTVTASDSMGNRFLESREIPLDEWGGFEIELPIPETPSLGNATVSLYFAGQTHAHTFQIQEFRRPEYEVSAKLEATGPFFVGDEIPFSGTARYYTGEALGGLDATWSAHAKRTDFSPPGWSQFSFGLKQRFWFWGPPAEDEARAKLEGVTDSAGAHRVTVELAEVDPPATVAITGKLQVTDINRQTWAGETSALVHPAAAFVGMRGDRNFVTQGEDVGIECIVTDVDGCAVAGRRITIELQRTNRVDRAGKQVEEFETVVTEAVSSAVEPVSVRLTPPKSGEYRIVARTGDDHDRVAVSAVWLWVAGEVPKNSRLQQGNCMVIPEATELRAGDVARVLVTGDVVEGYALVTARCGGIVDHREVPVQDGRATVEYTVAADLVPEFTLGVDVVGVDSKGQPAFATGSILLRVDDPARRLDLAVEAEQAELAPGGTTRVNICVSGAPPSGAAVAVWVVDEAILALSGYATPDPFRSMYAAQYGFASSVDVRSTLLLPGSEEEAPPDVGIPGLDMESGSITGSLALSESAFDGAVGGAAPMPPPSAPMAQAMAPRSAAAPGAPPGGFGGGGPGEGPKPVAVRTNFNPLAAWAFGKTDAEGRATFTVTVPDSLTRYRIMVNAVAGARQFGSADGSLTVRLPLTVRPSPPRFANFGDRFELPVVVHNASNATADIDVAIRANNLVLEQRDRDGKRVRLSPGARAEVRFDAQTKSAGDVKFQVVADTVTDADAASGSFPVYTPATTEAVATYGELDTELLVQPVEVPDGFEQFGGLEVTTSSTALSALTDAIVYLARYPYDCSEQRASRILAIAALGEMLQAFGAAELPSKAEMLESVATDVEHLVRLQHSDGGWGFWQRGESWPIVTLHVVRALLMAPSWGKPAPPQVLQRGLSYVQNIELHITDYSPALRAVVRAHAAFVLTLAGRPDAARAEAVVGDVASLEAPQPPEGGALEDLPLDAVAHCLSVLAGTPTGERLYRHLLNRASVTESTAQFAAEYHEQEGHLLLASSRRTDALALWALMDHAPQSDLIPKLVRGLLAHRKRGHWGSTQENSHVLLALKRYFDTYEAVEPDFVARVWFGGIWAGHHNFRGRTTERHHVDVPMADVVAADEKELIVQKEGPGRMYYRLGMRFAPKDLDLDPLNRGFEVSRVYEAVDDPDDVGRTDDGGWAVRAGARVRVRVTMVAPARRHHVALVDPIPAGFEILNPALKVTGDVPDDQPTQKAGQLWAFDGRHGRIFWWNSWQRTWFQHQNFRDERAEAFTSLLWEGVHEYVYTCRATTPGRFVVPPAKAEEMYSPEVFGRSATARVKVYPDVRVTGRGTTP